MHRGTCGGLGALRAGSKRSHWTAKAANVQLRELLMRQAARVAINRTVAGVHYPADSMAGQALGFAVGEYFIQRCRAGAAPANNVVSITFDGSVYP